MICCSVYMIQHASMTMVGRQVMMTTMLIAILMVTLHMDTEAVVLLVMMMMKSMFSLVHLAVTHIMVGVYFKSVHVHNDNFTKSTASCYYLASV